MTAKSVPSNEVLQVKILGRFRCHLIRKLLAYKVLKVSWNKITDDNQDELGDNFDIGDISDLDMLDQLKALVQLETFRTFSKSNIVVNGEDVHDKNRHPWLVALRTNGKLSNIIYS